MNILTGNLTSAALRLAIIEERLDHYQLSRVLVDYRSELARGYDRQGFKQLCLAKKNEWLHILLRNGLVPADPEHQEERNGEQEAIAAMTVQELYDALSAIQERLGQELKDVHQII